MGKGDKKSKHGKIIMGSFGVRRKARIQNKSIKNTATVEVKEEVVEAPPVEKKKATRTKKAKEE